MDQLVPCWPASARANGRPVISCVHFDLSSSSPSSSIFLFFSALERCHASECLSTSRSPDGFKGAAGQRHGQRHRPRK